MCTQAAADGGLLPHDTDDAIVHHLRSRSEIDEFDTGELVLSHNVLNYGLSCHAAVLETTTNRPPTTFELRKKLESNGWPFSRSTRDASATSKRGVDITSRTYHELLHDFYENVCEYEAEGVFNHRQSDGYYRALMVAMSLHPDVIEDIPFRQPIEFYEQLASFLQGSACVYLGVSDLNTTLVAAEHEADPRSGNNACDRPRAERRKRKRRRG